MYMYGVNNPYNTHQSNNMFWLISSSIRDLFHVYLNKFEFHFSRLHVNILKRKSFATITKMLFLFYWAKNFTPWYYDQQVQWFAVQTTWKSDQWDLRLPIFDKKCKATQIWKVTELQYLTFYRVTVLHYLTFYSEKVFNRYLFSKLEGQTNPSRLFYAFGNVHYVNVKLSIFDVIGRLSTTEYQ